MRKILQLSAQDAQFLYGETENNHLHVTGVTIFDPSTAPDGQVRFKQIIEQIASRTVTSPIYKRRILHVPGELDYPYWVDDEHFDIEYHIRHSRLPHPGDWRQFCIHLSRYHSQPLDKNRPPWEIYIIEGLDNIDRFPKGSYAMAMKIHHAAVDGHSAVNFATGLLDIDALGTPVMDLSQCHVEKCDKPTPMEMVRNTYLNAVRSPVKVANTLLKASPAFVRETQQRFQKSDPTNRSTVPSTRFNVETSPHKVFDAAIFKLQDFKIIRELSPGSTVNDVVLSVCAGGLRRYLEHHGELPAEPLRALAPVNKRASKGKTKEGEDAGNKITNMSVSLATNIADPVERFKTIHANTTACKEARSGLSAKLLTDIGGQIPASTQFFAARMMTRSDVAARLTNVMISNVPGPQQQTFMNGAKAIMPLGLAPISNYMGLFIGTPSGGGYINFCVTSARNIMPDVSLFVEYLYESFEELMAAAQSAAQSASTSKKKKAV